MKKAIGTKCLIPSHGGGGSGNSVAITGARIQAGWPGVQIPEVTKVFLFSKLSEPTLESIQPLIHYILWLLPGGEAAGT